MCVCVWERVCVGVCVSHRVSLVAICCRDSSLSWSDSVGKMFLSSSSRRDGRLLSLMASESFLNTFIARVPAQDTRGNAGQSKATFQPGAYFATEANHFVSSSLSVFVKYFIRAMGLR